MPVQYQRNKQRLLGRKATSRQTNKHTEECANTSKCSRVTGKPVTRHMSNGGHRDRPRSFACNRNRKRETSENHRIMWKPRAPSGLAVCSALSLVARSPPGLAETQHHNVGRHASSISGRCGVVLYLPQISLQSREDRSLTCCRKSRPIARPARPHPAAVPRGRLSGAGARQPRQSVCGRDLSRGARRVDGRCASGTTSARVPAAAADPGAGPCAARAATTSW